MNILVVDDEQCIREMYDEMLGHHCKYSVTTHPNYESVTPDETIDVYILDYTIHGGKMTGYQWLQKHGDDLVPPRKRILSSGMNEWKAIGVPGILLPKPVGLHDLVTAIKKIEKENQ